MSSHHIIRDKQEPALIIANGEACSLDLVEQLLEWSPTVVVLDGALERVISLGIKVDVWLGDFDHSLSSDFSEYPLKKVHTPDQNLTDLEKAFEYLLAEGYPAVNVVWASGKRMDHTLNNFHSMVRYGRKLKIVFFDHYSPSYLLPTYLFLDNRMNGWNNLSTSRSCGGLMNFLNSREAFSACSHACSLACSPCNCTPSLQVLNCTKTLSVSP